MFTVAQKSDYIYTLLYNKHYSVCLDPRLKYIGFIICKHCLENCYNLNGFLFEEHYAERVAYRINIYIFIFKMKMYIYMCICSIAEFMTNSFLYSFTFR